MPKPTESVDRRKLAAIMFTDMVGFSALTQGNEALALELLAEQQRLLTDVLELGRKTAREAHHFSLKYGSEAAARSGLVAGHAFGATTSLLAATMKRFPASWPSAVMVGPYRSAASCAPG